MSYREIRDTTEILRTLGYNRLVSVENFRYPNFALMAEILEWTVKKFDPNARLPKNLDNETDRVIFVKSCVLSLIQKARVKLNPKNLYQSDGHAIRELLPVLQMLYKTAQKFDDKNSESLEKTQISTLRSQINIKRQEMRRAVNIAQQLPITGANIYDLLSKEIFAKEARAKALSQSLNANEVEREIREKIEQTESKTNEVRFKLTNISSDEQDLEKKIERRQREYEQLQKRLAKLQSFRPPYMDEYEQFEIRLKELYGIYVILFRNLSYFQHQLWEVERAEKERHLNAERGMRIAVDKMRIENDSAPLISAITNEDIEMTKNDHLREVRVYGNMIGAGLSDDDDDDDDDEVEDDEEADGGGLNDRKNFKQIENDNDLSLDDDDNDDDDLNFDTKDGLISNRSFKASQKEALNPHSPHENEENNEEDDF